MTSKPEPVKDATATVDAVLFIDTDQALRTPLPSAAVSPAEPEKEPEVADKKKESSEKKPVGDEDEVEIYDEEDELDFDEFDEEEEEEEEEEKKEEPSKASGLPPNPYMTKPPTPKSKLPTPREKKVVETPPSSPHIDLESQTPCDDKIIKQQSILIEELLEMEEDGEILKIDLNVPNCYIYPLEVLKAERDRIERKNQRELIENSVKGFILTGTKTAEIITESIPFTAKRGLVLTGLEKDLDSKWATAMKPHVRKLIRKYTPSFLRGDGEDGGPVDVPPWLAILLSFLILGGARVRKNQRQFRENEDRKKEENTFQPPMPKPTPVPQPTPPSVSAPRPRARPVPPPSRIPPPQQQQPVETHRWSRPPIIPAGSGSPVLQKPKNQPPTRPGPPPSTTKKKEAPQDEEDIDDVTSLLRDLQTPK